MILYKVVNLETGMTYIGQTTRSVEERWKEHCKPALKNRSYLSNAIHKHGKDSFKVEELAKANTQEELNDLEIKAIESENCMWPNGYNLKHGGANGAMSNEAKEKIRNAIAGESKSKQTKDRISETRLKRGLGSNFKGKKHTPEALEKIRQAALKQHQRRVN